VSTEVRPRPQITTDREARSLAATRPVSIRRLQLRVTKSAAGLSGAVDQSAEVVIPLVAEELIVEKEQVVRGSRRERKAESG
jgi:hypothetical protein